MASRFYMPGSGLSGREKRRRLSRLSAPFFLGLSLIFILSERIAPAVPEVVRSVATDAAAPVLSLFRTPISFLQGAMERVVGVSDLYLEYEKLKSENDRLRRFRDAALLLGQENTRLRQILNVPGRENLTLATARIVGVGGGAFEESVIINAGKSELVRRDLPVVSDNQLIGRTISVGRFASRVLMITDLNSRVPVRVERTGALAIARGTNMPQLELDFLPEDLPAKIGDRLVTSGHGGLYPPDIPVAVVLGIDNDGIHLSPLASLDRMDYVRIIDYASPIIDVAESEQAEGAQP